MLVANLAKLELLLANPFAPPLQLAHRNLSAATEGTTPVPPYQQPATTTLTTARFLTRILLDDILSA